MPVYFIQAGGGPIKIGHTKNPERRLSCFQIGHCEKLRLLCTLKGDAPEERALHARFAQHLVRGEWFAPAPEIIAFAANPQPVYSCDSMTKKPKEPAASVIRKFGGRSKLARKTGIPASTIQRWEDSGHISPKRYPDLYAAAEREGIELSPADFAPPPASQSAA